MTRKMGVSLASAYEGDLAYFNAPDVVVEADADEELARAILERALQNEVPVGPLSSAGQVGGSRPWLHGAAGVPAGGTGAGMPAGASVLLAARSARSTRSSARSSERP